MPPLERPLDIIGFDDRDQKHPNGVQLPEWMPMHEFFMLVVAPAGSGKTTLILNVLLRIYPHYFNKILVFSPTIHNDQKWKHLTSAKKVLLKNPYQKLWASLEKGTPEEKGAPEEDEDYTQDEKLWLDMAQDTFIIEDFKKGKKPTHKRLGKQHQHMWALLSDAMNKKQNVDPKSIIMKKRRVDKLSAFICKPTTPVLAHEMGKELRLLNNGKDRFGGSEQGHDGGRAGGMGRSRRGSAHFSQSVQALTALQTNATEPSFFGPNFSRAGTSSNGIGGIGQPNGMDKSSLRRLFGGGGQERPNDAMRAAFLTRTNNSSGADGTDNTGDQLNDKKETQIHDSSTVYTEKNKSAKETKEGQVTSDCLFEEYSEETLEKIMKQQDAIVSHLTNLNHDMTKADHMCIVFDDMVGSGLFNQKRNNAFKRLTVRRRHFCASVIGVVQAYKEFPRTSRTNSNIYILFRIDSEDELQSIYTDFPCGLEANVWRILYDYCTREPFSFMMINLQVKDSQFRIVKNFNEPLYIPKNKQDHATWIQQYQYTPSASSSPKQASSSLASPPVSESSSSSRRSSSRSGTSVKGSDAKR